MTNLEKTEWYQELQEKKMRQRTIKHLAEALAYRFNIPVHESRLVWCLGTGSEGTNIEAMRNWVDRQLSISSNMYSPDLVDIFAKRLQNTLEALDRV